MTLTGKWKDILPLVKLLLDAGYGMDCKDTDTAEPHDERGMSVEIEKLSDGR